MEGHAIGARPQESSPVVVRSKKQLIVTHRNEAKNEGATSKSNDLEVNGKGTTSQECFDYSSFYYEITHEFLGRKKHTISPNYVYFDDLNDENIKSSVSSKKSVYRSSFLGRSLLGLDEASKVTDPSDKTVWKPVQKYVTGSRYIGEHNTLGFSREGVYRYPHGVIYDGPFNRTAQFHGPGKLIYPQGQTLRGIWKKGVLQPGATFVFRNGQVMDADHMYCKMPDRRFNVEVDSYMKAAGQEFLTEQQPTREIPIGCFDVGYGLYDPRTKFIMDYHKPDNRTYASRLDEFPMLQNDKWQTSSEDSESLSLESPKMQSISCSSVTSMKERENIIDIPSEKKERWIKDNCRKASDVPIGYRPDLYETWTSGQMNRKLSFSSFGPLMRTTASDNKLEVLEEKKTHLVSFIYKPPNALLYARTCTSNSRKPIKN